jgi:hypothetical protein
MKSIANSCGLHPRGSRPLHYMCVFKTFQIPSLIDKILIVFVRSLVSPALSCRGPVKFYVEALLDSNDHFGHDYRDDSFVPIDDTC